MIAATDPDSHAALRCAASPADDAWDFDIASSSTIWVGALSGLYQYVLNAATNRWSFTLYNAVTGINFVGVSTDRSTVYVVTGLKKISLAAQNNYTNLVVGA
jgi:hypothetical protein